MIIGKLVVEVFDKDPMELSGFVAIAFFKKSSDPKRKSWERPMVTFFNNVG